MLERWKHAARGLEREALALYFACRDPRVPWYARLLAAAVVGYALSPIDLIPDFIPVLGVLDDLLIIPLGVLAVRALVPPALLEECRQRAASLQERPRSRIAAVVIVGLWLAAAMAVLWWLLP